MCGKNKAKVVSGVDYVVLREELCILAGCSRVRRDSVSEELSDSQQTGS